MFSCIIRNYLLYLFQIPFLIVANHARHTPTTFYFPRKCSCRLRCHMSSYGRTSNYTMELNYLQYRLRAFEFVWFRTQASYFHWILQIFFVFERISVFFCVSLSNKSGKRQKLRSGNLPSFEENLLTFILKPCRL